MTGNHRLASEMAMNAETASNGAVLPVTVVIPTYNRNQILVHTLEHVLGFMPAAEAVIVVDQTVVHEPDTERRLQAWADAGRIRWLHMSPPSIPHAMNAGLRAASTEYVLFLDDDLIPRPDLVAAHVHAIRDVGAAGNACWAVVGQVIQPDQEEVDFATWTHTWFPFHCNRRQFIADAMSGNLLVDRHKAIEIGGFDENYFGSAYKYDSEFGRRVVGRGGRVLFEPTASVRHLRIYRGGTRAWGHHLTTWKPHHSAGKYYYAFTGGVWEAFKALLVQPWRAVRTRHHLHKPWYIPVTLVAEVLGILCACWLCIRGPRHITHPVSKGNGGKAVTLADRGKASAPPARTMRP